MLISQYGIISPRAQLVTLWQVAYVGLLSTWRKQTSILRGIDTQSVHRFAFPAYTASASTTTQVLGECFIYQHWVPCRLVLQKRKHFTEKS